jgi:hypothetical protein
VCEVAADRATASRSTLAGASAPRGAGGGGRGEGLDEHHRVVALREDEHPAALAGEQQRAVGAGEVDDLDAALLVADVEAPGGGDEGDGAAAAAGPRGEGAAAEDPDGHARQHAERGGDVGAREEGDEEPGDPGGHPEHRGAQPFRVAAYGDT